MALSFSQYLRCTVVRCRVHGSTVETCATMTFGDLALTLLTIAHTCRTCQFPVYLQSSEPGRRRDWRARSRSSRVTSLRLIVDGGTLSWNALERDARDSDDVTPIYADHCLEETKHVAGLYVQCTTGNFERSLRRGKINQIVSGEKERSNQTRIGSVLRTLHSVPKTATLFFWS